MVTDTELPCFRLTVTPFQLHNATMIWRHIVGPTFQSHPSPWILGSDSGGGIEIVDISPISPFFLWFIKFIMAYIADCYNGDLLRVNGVSL